MINKTMKILTTGGDRLGWRLAEWTALTGTSRPTVWRQIKRGDLNIVRIGGIPIVPRSEAVRLGLLATIIT